MPLTADIAWWGLSGVRLFDHQIIREINDLSRKQFWAGGERVGGRTGGGDLLVKQEVVARRSGESFKL